MDLVNSPVILAEVHLEIKMNAVMTRVYELLELIKAML